VILKSALEACRKTSADVRDPSKNLLRVVGHPLTRALEPDVAKKAYREQHDGNDQQDVRLGKMPE
jgi:hypothetical protein